MGNNVMAIIVGIIESSRNAGQKYLSYLGPKLWNSLPSELKPTNNINTFKHKIKENFFQNIQKEEDDIYVFY